MGGGQRHTTPRPAKPRGSPRPTLSHLLVQPHCLSETERHFYILTATVTVEWNNENILLFLLIKVVVFVLVRAFSRCFVSREMSSVVKKTWLFPRNLNGDPCAEINSVEVYVSFTTVNSLYSWLILYFGFFMHNFQSIILG